MKKWEYIEYNSDCIVLNKKEEYGYSEKIELKCRCGNIFKVTFNSFKNRKRNCCVECAKENNIKKIRENRILEIKKLCANNNIIYTDVSYIYKNNKTIYYIEFLENNLVLKKELFTLKKYILCKNNKKLLNEKKLKDLKEEFKKYKIEILSNEFKSVDDIMSFKCSCGRKFYSTTYRIRASKFKKCKKCSNILLGITQRKDKLQYKKEFYLKNKDKFELLSDYVKVELKIKIKCKKCGNETFANPRDLLKDYNCKLCSPSKGEGSVIKFLLSNKINFKKEHTFEDCKDRARLRFDFYLEEYNVCIEYDGFQHYTPHKTFGGVREYISRRKRDMIKNRYCRKNNIKLIRIPFWDYKNIKNILRYSLLL